MEVRQGISHDIKLRNLNIYAAWCGILSGMAFTMLSLLNFFLRTYKPVGPYKPISLWDLWSFLFLSLIPIAAEMPHVFKRIPGFPRLFCCFIPWWLALARSWRERLTSSWCRVGIYIAYAINLSIWFSWGYQHGLWAPRLSLDFYAWSHPATLLALTAASLYALAGLRGHKFVFSRMLGGSGVEEIGLILPGYAPDYENIGEGQIRLT